MAALSGERLGFVIILKSRAPLAQLDRASGYEPEGREFESLRARHSLSCMHFVYVLRSTVAKRRYVGSCADVNQRFGQHNEGLASSTKHWRPDWKGARRIGSHPGKTKIRSWIESAAAETRRSGVRISQGAPFLRVIPRYARDFGSGLPLRLRYAPACSRPLNASSSNLSGRAILKPSPRCIYAAMASGLATPAMQSPWLRHDVEFHCIRVSSAASIKPWPRRGSLNSRILPPSPTMRMRKHSPRLTKESRTLRLSGLCLPRKSGNACASGLPDPLHGKGAERSR